MIGYISGYNFTEMEPQKYWAPPASWDISKRQTEVRTRVFSGEWYAAEKKDGYFAKLIKDEDGNILLHSRSKNVNGVYPEKHEWVPHLNPFFEELPNGTCLLGELYLPSKPGSSNITSLLGCLKEKCVARQEVGEKLHFYVFDILAWEGKSYITKPMVDRIEELILMWRAGYMNEYVEIAEYFNGEALWNKLGEILTAGGEGMVLIRGGAPYQPGKRPSKDCMKVKKEINQTIDCIFTGVGTPPTRPYEGKEIETWKYWENVRTGEKMEGDFYKEYTEGAPIEPVTKPYFHGWVSSLEIGLVRGNKVVPIGLISGLTDEVKANHQKYKGLPIEVTCMEITQNQNGGFGLRHAKLVRFRPDLNIADCSWDKVFNENE